MPALPPGMMPPGMPGFGGRMHGMELLSNMHGNASALRLPAVITVAQLTTGVTLSLSRATRLLLSAGEQRPALAALAGAGASQQLSAAASAGPEPDRCASAVAVAGATGGGLTTSVYVCLCQTVTQSTKFANGKKVTTKTTRTARADGTVHEHTETVLFVCFTYVALTLT